MPFDVKIIWFILVYFLKIDICKSHFRKSYVLFISNYGVLCMLEIKNSVEIEIPFFSHTYCFHFRRPVFGGTTEFLLKIYQKGSCVRNFSVGERGKKKYIHIKEIMSS